MVSPASVEERTAPDCIRGSRAVLLAILVLGCALPGSEARREEALVRETNALSAALAEPATARRAAGALRVRLVFGAPADLDLYVTDPLAETVYFANSPSRSGGALDRDARCSDESPRIETVTFEAPLPGRYRVGVDFPERCEGGSEEVPFVVVLEHGRVRREQRGRLRLYEFAPILLETDIETGPVD